MHFKYVHRTGSPIELPTVGSEGPDFGVVDRQSRACGSIPPTVSAAELQFPDLHDPHALCSLKWAAPAPFGRGDGLAIVAILALWGASAILAHPVGDFPLNDDWAYALPVKWLVETGRLRFTDWQCMTLITQVLWGSLFAGVAGFSFNALRVSTLVIAAVGLIATYLVGRELGLSRWLAGVVAGLFAINPVFLSLSLTFLTDVPFWGLASAAVFLLLRGARTGYGPGYWAGWVVILAAMLVRQVGLAIPIGMIFGLALKDGPGRSWLVRAVLPTAVLFAVVAAYPRVVRATIGLPGQYFLPQDALWRALIELLHLRLGALKPLLTAIGSGSLHIGLWLLPLLLLLPTPRVAGDRGGWVTPVLVIGCAMAVTMVLWTSGQLMPLGIPGNILVDLGTGVRSISGEFPRAPTVLWVAITAVSATGAALLVLHLASIVHRVITQLHSPRDRRALWPAVFLAIAGASFCGTFATFGPWYDRYLLLVASLLGSLVAGFATTSTALRFRPSALGAATSAALALIYLGFSVTSAHDYLAWNRSRWEASRFLISEQDVAPADIDGGFEFNHYFSWIDRPGGTYGSGDGAAPDRPPGVRRDRRFTIAIGDLPGYTLERRVPVDRWSRLTPGHVAILRRIDGSWRN